ncbi:MAG TPA: DNA mismatch repair endonuclease MutL [Clostridiales bacterium]|nr:DNA mismatch repair endonuclease MutL [Clostridiales bacterium]
MEETIIHVLDPQTANLIAAGEVVDRPASVVKELLENAIDAGSNRVTVEIKGGGSSLIRVTDNGKGMSRDDVKLSVKRHATSKIQNPADLDAIFTLGFRGEALAAISSVSRFSILSRKGGDDMGFFMETEGETLLSADETGAPEGTTVRVENLFFNQPARRKFLKRDATETAAVTQLVERIALSHPEESIQLITDGVLKLQTPGSGDLKETVYTVLGRDFSDGMLPLDDTFNSIRVSGYLCRPEHARANRSLQCFYINGRYVRSKTCMFALEDAHKSYMQSDKFPACVLFLTMDPKTVDVNVHPAKLEVRFGDERVIYNAVYFAVKNALETITNAFSKPSPTPVYQPAVPEKPPEQLTILPSLASTPKLDAMAEKVSVKDLFSPKPTSAIGGELRVSSSLFQAATPREAANPVVSLEVPVTTPKAEEKPKAEPMAEARTRPTTTMKLFSDYTILGLLFKTYILVEAGDNFYMIDKHAAHERILYEGFKQSRALPDAPRQELLEPVTVTVSPLEYDALEQYKEEIEQTGFSLSPFGENVFALRAVPVQLTGKPLDTLADMVKGMAGDLMGGGRASNRKEEALNKALYSAACRAALKAGSDDLSHDLQWVVDKLLEMENVTYCPHGRPVLVKLSRQQVEKLFSRI